MIILLDKIRHLVSVTGLHVCLERQELFNAGVRLWHKFGADQRQLFPECFVVCLEEPIAIDGVRGANCVPVEHQYHQNIHLVALAVNHDSVNPLLPAPLLFSQ